MGELTIRPLLTIPQALNKDMSPIRAEICAEAEPKPTGNDLLLLELYYLSLAIDVLAEQVTMSVVKDNSTASLPVTDRKEKKGIVDWNGDKKVDKGEVFLSKYNYQNFYTALYGKFSAGLKAHFDAQIGKVAADTTLEAKLEQAKKVQAALNSPDKAGLSGTDKTFLELYKFALEIDIQAEALTTKVVNGAAKEIPNKTKLTNLKKYDWNSDGKVDGGEAFISAYTYQDFNASTALQLTPAFKGYFDKKVGAYVEDTKVDQLLKVRAILLAIGGELCPVVEQIIPDRAARGMGKMPLSVQGKNLQGPFKLELHLEGKPDTKIALEPDAKRAAEETPTQRFFQIKIASDAPIDDPKTPEVENQRAAKVRENDQSPILAGKDNALTVKQFEIVSVKPALTKGGEPVQLEIKGSENFPEGVSIRQVQPKDAAKLPDFPLEIEKVSDDKIFTTPVTVPADVEPGKYPFEILNSDQEQLTTFELEVGGTGETLLSWSKAEIQGRLGYYGTSAGTAKEAAVASVLPYHLEAGLKLDPPLLNAKNDRFGLKSEHLGVTSHHALKLGLNGVSEGGFNTSHGVTAQSTTTPYLQPFVNGGLEYDFRRYANPSLFYADSSDFSLQVMGGLATAVDGNFAASVAFKHRYTWFNHTFDIPERGLKGYEFAGKTRQESLVLNLEILSALKLEAGIGLPTSRTQMPNDMMVGDTVVYKYKEAKKLSELTLKGILDLRYVELSAGYSSRQVDGWKKTSQINLGAHIKTNPVELMINYDRYQLDPTTPQAPFTMNRLGATYFLPVLGNSIGLGAFGLFGDVNGFGGGVRFNAERLLNTGSSRAKPAAPAVEAEAPAPASADKNEDAAAANLGIR